MAGRCAGAEALRSAPERGARPPGADHDPSPPAPRRHRLHPVSVAEVVVLVLVGWCAASVATALVVGRLIAGATIRARHRR